MNDTLRHIVETKNALASAIEAVVQDSTQSVAVRVAAIIHGEPSPTRKQQQVTRILKMANLIEDDASVHVRNEAIVASQVSVTRITKPHYVAALLGDDFCLVRFDAAQARKVGTPCHGTLQHSDAVRASVDDIGEFVYMESLNG